MGICVRLRLTICIFLAIAILAPLPSFGQECPDNDLDCWLKILKKNDGKEALRATMVLGNIGDAKAVDPLISKLESKDKYMATAAAYALSKIGEPAVPALIEATKHKKSSVRKYAAHALTQIGGDHYKVLSSLCKDEDPAVRLRALKGLIVLNDKRATIDGVLLLKDRQTEIRLQALHLLKTLDDDRVVESVINYGLIDMSPRVSTEAAIVLIHFGDKSVDSLITQFEGQSDFVQIRTVYILGEIARKKKGESRDKSLDYLIRIVKAQKLPPKVKQVAVSKLADVGDPKALPALQKLLSEVQGKEGFEDLIQVTLRSIEKLQKK